MDPTSLDLYDDLDDLPGDAEEAEQASEDDLWFLPGPMEEEPDYLLPGHRAEPRETEVLADWAQASAGSSATGSALIDWGSGYRCACRGSRMTPACSRAADGPCGA
jgi:hypothetical protein